MTLIGKEPRMVNARRRSSKSYSLNSRSASPDLLFCCDYKASCPFTHILSLKNLTDTANHTEAARRMETHQQNAAVSPWDIKPRIREIQALRNQKPLLTLSGIPYLWISTSCESFFLSCVNVVPQLDQNRCKPHQEIFVELNLHRIEGTAGTGRSSSAEAAAKEMAA